MLRSNVNAEDGAAGSDKMIGSSVRTAARQCLTSRQKLPALSEREWDILEYLVDGYRNRDICRELGLQTSTITRYFLRLQAKLEAKSVAHCLVRAFEVELLILVDGTVIRNPATLR